MVGAAKKRAKQGRSDNSTAKDTKESRIESNDDKTQVSPLGFDGPGDSRPGSTLGPPGSRFPTISDAPSEGSQSGVRLPVIRPMPHDPARQPEYNRNIDLPGNAYNLWSQVSSSVIA